MKLNRKTRAVVQRRKNLIKKHKAVFSLYRMHERFEAHWTEQLAKSIAENYPDMLIESAQERLAHHKREKGKRWYEAFQIERKLDKRVDNLWKAIFEPSDEPEDNTEDTKPDDDARDMARLRGEA